MPKVALTLGFLLAGVLAHSQVKLDSYPVDETDKTPIPELRLRRAQIKQTLGPGTVGVLFTNPTRNRNNDVDFIFRGDSNFLYLTGFEEPDSALILAPDGIEVDGRKATEILFVNEPDMASITWLGYRMGPANAEKMLGVEMALPNKRYLEVLNLALKDKPKVSVMNRPDGPAGLVGVMMEQTRGAISSASLGEGPRTGSKFRGMRGIKSAYEIAMLKKVCDISAKAHVEAMKSIKPGQHEWEVAAMQQFIFAKNGCEFYGYPCICGSGPNSTILHYESNRRQMLDGDILCTDSAGEYHGYSADVTRSYPVNGKYTPAQRDIYEAVYNAQETGINMCKAGASYNDISNAISNSLADSLMKLGVIKDKAQLGLYYMHGFGHGIGLDVHDALPEPLVAGACMTVEPGIYIKEGSPCDPKWWNIGVRIEDDILVTDGAPVNMSAAAPRKWQDIEKLMAKKG